MGAHEGEFLDSCAVGIAAELYRTLPDVNGLATTAAVAARHTAAARRECSGLPDGLMVWPVVE